MHSKEQRQITLQGKPILYLLAISTRSRRLRISVSDQGVSLILPAGLPVREGEAFLQKNADWVLKQVEKHEKIAAKNKRTTLPNNVILLRGTPTRVELVEEAERKLRARVQESAGRLIIRIPVGARKTVPAVAEAYLREQARQEILAVVTTQARRMRLTPKALSIRDQRTRWGSCSSRGTLSFNWRLIMVPPAIMEYVVIHELAHLVVPNHSTQFWSLVIQYFPEYKQARSWLRKNAPLLHPKMFTDL